MHTFYRHKKVNEKLSTFAVKRYHFHFRFNMLNRFIYCAVTITKHCTLRSVHWTFLRSMIWSYKHTLYYIILNSGVINRRVYYEFNRHWMVFESDFHFVWTKLVMDTRELNYRWWCWYYIAVANIPFYTKKLTHWPPANHKSMQNECKWPPRHYFLVSWFMNQVHCRWFIRCGFIEYFESTLATRESVAEATNWFPTAKWSIIIRGTVCCAKDAFGKAWWPDQTSIFIDTFYCVDTFIPLSNNKWYNLSAYKNTHLRFTCFWLPFLFALWLILKEPFRFISFLILNDLFVRAGRFVWLSCQAAPTHSAIKKTNKDSFLHTRYFVAV